MEELELERQQGSSLRNRCFKVFLLGLDTGLPGNNQSQHRLEAGSVVIEYRMSQNSLRYFMGPCNLACNVVC